MSKTRIKRCGITNEIDAKNAVRFGADTIGLNFYEKSPRYISPEKARQICSVLPKNVTKIGVFVNPDPDMMDKIDQEDFLDYYQFHGEESPETCDRYQNKAIKAFGIDKDFDKDSLITFGNCQMFLFDTKVTDVFGGSGTLFDWDIIKAIHRTHHLILAGGINKNNVADAIHKVQPEMFDVSSSVEIFPGKKDSNKMKQFIGASRRANGQVKS